MYAMYDLPRFDSKHVVTVPQ